MAGFLQSEVTVLLRNGAMNHWGANGIDLGMNSQYCEVQSDPSLRNLSKVAVESFKASEKLKFFSGESLNLQKTIDLGKEVE